MVGLHKKVVDDVIRQCTPRKRTSATVGHFLGSLVPRIEWQLPSELASDGDVVEAIDLLTRVVKARVIP